MKAFRLNDQELVTVGTSELNNEVYVQYHIVRYNAWIKGYVIHVNQYAMNAHSSLDGDEFYQAGEFILEWDEDFDFQSKDCAIFSLDLMFNECNGEL